MLSLNSIIRSINLNFVAFVALYRADESAPAATRNDLVRAWNIVQALRSQESSTVLLDYAALNISQSSVRTMVSKLNAIFRHLGMLDHGDTIGIHYLDFYTARIHLHNVRIGGVRFANEMAERSGRGQDRVLDRHEDGHREKHTIDYTDRLNNLFS